jgi:hypothetical protein
MAGGRYTSGREQAGDGRINLGFINVEIQVNLKLASKI